jgi:hypothetical protein
MRGRSGYKAGFRGGRGMRGGFRGRGGSIGRGVNERYIPRLRGGFRGRARGGFNRNGINNIESNTGYTEHTNYNHNIEDNYSQVKSERPIRGGFRAFGRYRSKFDPVNRESTKN